jgi:hypothetical protein
MKGNSIGPKESALHPAPLALVLSLFGWTLLEAWLVWAGAGVAVHGFVAAIGIALTTLSLWRSRQLLRSTPRSSGLPSKDGDAGAAYAILLFFAVGACLGSLVVAGQLVLLWVAQAALNVVPWWKLRFYRRHFYFSCVTMWLGASIVVAACYRTLSFIALPLDAWAVWCGALFSLLLTIERAARAGRAFKAEACDLVRHTPHASKDDTFIT